MTNKPYVVFSQRAFNSIVTETIHKNPVETGGILIGYVLDNGVRIVVENIPPGQNSQHKWGYFEYDENFVNYLSNVVARQYVGNLQVLGLWHRHPGSLDTFSSTDDGTNLLFAQEQTYGSISALVNCDSKMRITMYHVSQQGKYTHIDWFVDDGDLIPKEYLQLWYTSENSLPDLDKASNEQMACQEREPENIEQVADNRKEEIFKPVCDEKYTMKQAISDIKEILNKLTR